MLIKQYRPLGFVETRLRVIESLSVWWRRRFLWTLLNKPRIPWCCGGDDSGGGGGDDGEDGEDGGGDGPLTRK